MELDEKRVNEILKNRHLSYLKRCLGMLPESSSWCDGNRLSVAFFVISSIDLLGSSHVLEQERSGIIDWIYSLQIEEGDDIGKYGFRGSPANGKSKYDFGNLAMIYTSLASLLILGDDLSGVNKKAIIRGMKELQLEDGSFAAMFGSENDMRFLYCASVVSHILQDWSGVDVDKAVEFIKNSWSYEGAFGQSPGCEAHGGSTYCAVASLSLMNRLSSTLSKRQIASLKRWCLMKQVSGFQGRPNKDPDTCYSFWVGATLKILDAYHLSGVKANFDFVISTQDCITGGFGKTPHYSPDPLHTYLGISGLSLIPAVNQAVMAVNPELNISERAVNHLRCLHENNLLCF